MSRHEKLLAALERRNRLRRLAPRHGVDFSSNDYLALAESRYMRDAVHAALERGVPVGAGGSRLLRGNHPEHEALEAEAAAFFKAERALYFGSGFAANAALVSVLPGRDDLVVHDALIHASCHQGMRAGEAQCVAAGHNDAQAFDDAIRRWRGTGAKGQPWIVVESVYSMDGDRAPLGELAAIADRHDAMLIVDEAHATGVHGPEGRGLAADLDGRDRLVSLHTCGKALGAIGALVCAPRAIADFLVNRSRAFIYSTAPSPLMAAGVRAGMAALRTQPSLRERLSGLIGFVQRGLASHCGVPASGSQIVPVVLGESARALQFAAALQSRGFDVRAIRPPTVPEGTARLRISITLHVNEALVSALFQALAEEIERAGALAGPRR